jgi:hypothetical protein
MSIFTLIPIIFCQILTCIALVDLDFHFSHADAVEGETK